jgi:hypothetical protein
MFEGSLNAIESCQRDATRLCGTQYRKILASLMPETPRVAQDEELKPGLSAARSAALLCAWRMATRVSGLEPRIIVSIA